MRMQGTTGRWAALLLGATLLWSLACSKGDRGGRVGVSEVTEGERKSGQIYGGDLFSASDDVAMALAGDINRLSEEDWGGYRVTLILGDISNKTRAMPTSDFEVVRDRIKNKLSKSRLFRDNVKVVANRQRVESMNRKELGNDDEDLLDEGKPDKTKMRTGNPEYTFYLLGNAYAVHRGDTVLYYMAFTLTRAADGEEVFAQDYEVKYRVDD